MDIRKLTEADYPAALALYTELDRLHADARPDYFVLRDPAYPKDAYDEVIADQNCLMLGCFDRNGDMIGSVRATLWQKSGMVEGIKTVCLDDIYVQPCHRREGIGRRLFAEVEAWAKDLGAVRLDLHVWGFNQDALALYRCLGMTPQYYVLDAPAHRKP